MLKPSSPDKPWRVVVVGRWNRAILSPRGIARRLFSLPEGTEIMIQVPLDGVGPLRVKHEKMAVIVDEGMLVIEPADRDFEQLKAAMELARKAVEDLPQTPYSAVGINCMFTIDAAYLPFKNLWSEKCDEALVAAGFAMTTRRMGRTIKYEGGEVNFSVLQAEGKPYDLFFNFHRDSTDPAELAAWLSMPIDTLKATVDRIANAIGID